MLYPATYKEGNISLPSQGCVEKNPLCPLGQRYNRAAPTKQNLLCNRQAALEMMLNHPDLKDNDNAGPVQDRSDQVLTKKIRNVESFQIELVCLKLFIQNFFEERMKMTFPGTWLVLVR